MIEIARPLGYLDELKIGLELYRDAYTLAVTVICELIRV